MDTGRALQEWQARIVVSAGRRRKVPAGDSGEMSGVVRMEAEGRGLALRVQPGSIRRSAR